MNIVFFIGASFPYGEAYSRRAFNLCKLISETGIKVHVISDSISNNVEETLNYCTIEPVVKKEIFCKNFLLKKIKKNKIAFKRLEEYCNNYKVDAIFTSSRSDRFFWVKKFCKKRKLKLFIESCEWFDKSTYKFGYLDYRFYRNEWMLRYGFKGVDGIISISRLLDLHNEKMTKLSIRIPTIMDVYNTKYKIDTDIKVGKIKIIYAGSLGNGKELLYPIINVLNRNKNVLNKIEFHIYGPHRSEIIRNIKCEKILNNILNSSVFIHGFLDQQKMLHIMREAHFLLFIRPNRKSSNAGFPTKFVESMSVGTPVITNNTGDINLYLKDECNGYLITDELEKSLEKILKEIVHLKNDKYKILRENARKTAEVYFHYQRYYPEIKKLFKIIKFGEKKDEEN